MRPLFTLALLVLLSCTVTNKSFATNNLVHITSGEFPPWVSPKLKYEGVASRIIKEAFAREGYQVDFEYYPWGRAFELARLGQMDGSSVWQYNKKREQDFYFSRPLVQSKSVIFHLKTLPMRWENFSDLKAYSIATTAGYSYGAAFDRARYEIPLRVYESATDYLNLKKLLGGRYQLFIVDLDVGMFLLRTQFKPEDLKKIAVNSKIIGEENLHLILNKKNPEHAALMQKFNTGLAALQREGLTERYLMESRRGDYVIEYTD